MEVGPGQYVLPRNMVHLALSDGGIALAHDLGVTVLEADGTVRGGETGALTFSSTTNGFALVETDGEVLLLATRPNAFPSSSAPITAQRLGLDGAGVAAATDVVAAPVQPPTTNAARPETTR